MKTLATNIGAMAAMLAMDKAGVQQASLQQRHADLTKSTINVPEYVQAAARAVYEQGGAPREQLEAARKTIGHNGLTYTPHVGAKQKAKEQRRAAKRA